MIEYLPSYLNEQLRLFFASLILNLRFGHTCIHSCIRKTPFAKARSYILFISQYFSDFILIVNALVRLAKINLTSGSIKLETLTPQVKKSEDASPKCSEDIGTLRAGCCAF